MGADYKNWMPKGMVASFTGGAAGSWIATLGVHILMPEGIAKHVMMGLTTAAGKWKLFGYRLRQQSAGHCKRKKKS